MTRPLDAAIAAFEPRLPLAVAYSGGADSSALLHACASRWPGQVLAVHINHGLQAAASDFEQHCRTVCAGLGVPLHVSPVNAHARAGQSPEDAARLARYGALRAFALPENAQPPCATVALAQHADDQVETLLLALSRGAGLAGLSAMPARWLRDGVDYARPLLDVSAADIRAWLTERGLPWIEDPSNAHTGFLRNRMRAELLPVLRAIIPHYVDTLPRSASHAAQAQALLNEIAKSDLQALCAPGGSSPLIAALQTLSMARQANVLRHWLSSVHHTQASSAQLQELLAQIAACTTRGHQLHIRVGHGFVRRSNGVLDWYNPPV
jgi:tRNA(Ile)-lysidine synthase